MVMIRPARAEDREAVERISARIWEGNDYVPLFFAQWMKKKGFFVAAMNGKIVGWDRGSETSKGKWWLEGLRVDPKLQGKGIGLQLFRHMKDWVLSQRPVSLRLSTAEISGAAYHMNQRMGFQVYSQSWLFEGSAPRPRPGPEPVKPRVDEALEFLRRSEELKASRGLLAHTWRFREADRTYLAELVRKGCAHAVRRGSRLEGLLIVQPHGYHPADLDITFLGGTRRAQAVLAAFVSRLAAERGTRQLSGMAASDEMAEALRRLDMKLQKYIGRVSVFEYPI